jgi:hypothetical protein
MAENLTDITWLCMWLSMGRKLHIKIKFSPTRLSNELMHSAYELVFPVVSRTAVDREPRGKKEEYEGSDSISIQNINTEGRR